MKNIEQVRELFPGAQDKTFLDSACVGLAPTNAKAAVMEFMELAVRCPSGDVSQHHIRMDELKEEALSEACTLFNASDKNMTLIESTTHGLNIAANTIPFSTNDEVIICDTEYLQVGIPFMKKAEQGLLKVVPLAVARTHKITMDNFLSLMTKATKAICLSSVQWCTGQKVFSKELGEICKEKGIWLIVDGVQEAGALSVDMTERYCDFYVTGGHKWLNSPYGCGIMFMSDRAIELSPNTFGYLNLYPPDGDWGAYFQNPKQSPFRHFDFPKKARSFGIGGTGNYPGAIGLGASLKLVNKVGPKKIEDKVIALSTYAKERLSEIGAKIISPSERGLSSGITIFRMHEDYQGDLDLLERLKEHKVLLSIRYTNGHGGLRLSTHYFNDKEDIDRLCCEITA